MTIDAVIFDLDGTLLNTLGDIAAAANRVLAESGFPPHPDESYKQFIGSGVRMLFHRALPPDADTDDQIEHCVLRFLHAYNEGWNIRTRPYDGIPELLDELARRDIDLTVLSNKPDAFTRRCVEFYFARRPFRAVSGDRPDRPRKPDPAGRSPSRTTSPSPPTGSCTWATRRSICRRATGRACTRSASPGASARSTNSGSMAPRRSSITPASSSASSLRDETHGLGSN